MKTSSMGRRFRLGRMPKKGRVKPHSLDKHDHSKGEQCTFGADTNLDKTSIDKHTDHNYCLIEQKMNSNNKVLVKINSEVTPQSDVSVTIKEEVLSPCDKNVTIEKDESSQNDASFMENGDQFYKNDDCSVLFNKECVTSLEVFNEECVTIWDNCIVYEYSSCQDGQDGFIVKTEICDNECNASNDALKFQKDILDKFANELNGVIPNNYILRKTSSKLQLLEFYDNGITTSIKLSVDIYSDFTCDIYVHRKKLSKTHDFWKTLPSHFTTTTRVIQLLEKLSKLHVCIGNPDHELCALTNVGTSFYDKYESEIRAYHEGDFNASVGDLRYSGTIRSVSCDLLVKQKGNTKRCFSCSTYRSGLRRRFKRIEEKKNKNVDFIHSKLKHDKHKDMTREDLITMVEQQSDFIQDLKKQIDNIQKDNNKSVVNAQKGTLIRKHEIIKKKKSTNNTVSDSQKKRPRTYLKHKLKSTTGDKKYTCPFCSKTFIHSSVLQSHVLHAHQEKLPTCTICFKEFQSVSNCKEHMVSCTAGPISQKTVKPSMTFQEKMEKRDLKKQFKCRFCSKFFCTLKYLKNHEILYHTNTENLPKCNICNQRLPNEHLLSIHMNHHAGLTWFKCDECSDEFTTVSSLRRHIMLIHREEKLYECPICNEKFPRLRYLNLHVKVHAVKRPFKCKECPCAFNANCNLQKHMITHKDLGKVHKCEVCEKTFCMASTLKYHMKVHTGDKPAQCDICGKTFLCASSLKKHTYTHVPVGEYKCSFCDKIFTKLRDFDKHMKSHTGQQPEHFLCFVCGKTFGKLTSLSFHQRNHI